LVWSGKLVRQPTSTQAWARGSLSVVHTPFPVPPLLLLPPLVSSSFFLTSQTKLLVGRRLKGDISGQLNGDCILLLLNLFVFLFFLEFISFSPLLRRNVIHPLSFLFFSPFFFSSFSFFNNFMSLLWYMNKKKALLQSATKNLVLALP
jgi:hypothetical protein